MKDAPKPTYVQAVLTGTPVEIGCQLWERACLPSVRIASTEITPVELGRFYAGIIASAYGSMAADFGHAQALSFARETLAAFEKFVPPSNDGSAGMH